MSVQKGFRTVCNTRGCEEAGPWIEIKPGDSRILLFEDAEDDLKRAGWRLIEGGILCPLCVRIAERGLTLASAEGGGL